MTPLLYLLDQALHHDQVGALESHLLAHGRLPGPRANLKLLHTFAEEVGAYLDRADPDVAALETLLDGWAADPSPADDPRIALPCAAALAYAQAAVSRPEWREDEIAKLRRLSADPRPAVQDAVADALRHLDRPQRS